MLILNIY